MNSGCEPQASATAPPAKAEAQRRPALRLWGRRLAASVLLAAVVAGAAYLSRAWWLPMLARGLVFNEDFEHAAVIVPIGGASSYQRAATELRAGHATQIGIYRTVPSRLETRGVLPDPWQQAHLELADLGVPPHALAELPEVVAHWSTLAEMLADRLRLDPAAQVVILVPEYRSRWFHSVFDGLFSAADRSRVRVAAVDHATVSADNWWHTRAGQRVIVTEWVRIASTWLGSGESGPLRTSEEFRAAGVAR
jgi:hypothetical protein